jgi:hypothetical protein
MRRFWDIRLSDFHPNLLALDQARFFVGHNGFSGYLNPLGNWLAEISLWKASFTGGL